MPNSLPVGIATVDCSFGIYLDMLGNIDSGKVTLTVSDELIWAATGDVIETIEVSVGLDATGRVLIALPIIQPGFITSGGQAINSWTYTAKWAGFHFNKTAKTFTLTSSDIGPVDIDKKASAGAQPPTNPLLTSYVNTIQVGTGLPMSGNVVLPASVGGTGSGTSTVAAITDATALGKSLLLSADAAAAKTQLALDKVNNTTDALKPISTATQAALNLLVTNQVFQQALQGLVTTAVLTAALKTKMDATVPALLFMHNQSGSWTPRPVTAAGVPVAVLSYDGTNPPGGGTVGGGAGAVDGLDIVFLNASNP